MQPAVVRVAVCVITFRRPEGLARLIHALNQLRFRGDPPQLEIVVVDNDAAGAARAVCDELRDELESSLQCVAEPRRGIPQARNKAVACVVDRVDFLVFIDDDEVPEPDWLDELMKVQRRFDADVVAGPVVPRFMEEPPAWLRKDGFFNRADQPTGTTIRKAATNNTMVRAAVFDAMPWHFNERMSLTGGSDIEFFRRVHQAGYRMVWANDAIVHDLVPASRATAAWIYRRSYRYGTSNAFIEFLQREYWQAAALLLAVGPYKMIKGVAMLAPWLLIRGRGGFVRSVRLICYGAGQVLGLFGRSYDEYEQIHGQ